MGVSSKNVVSNLVSKLSMKVSVSVLVSTFVSAWYHYQYQSFRPAKYQYRMGIEFLDQERISIVSESEKVASKGSGRNPITYCQTLVITIGPLHSKLHAYFLTAPSIQWGGNIKKGIILQSDLGQKPKTGERKCCYISAVLWSIIL